MLILISTVIVAVAVFDDGRRMFPDFMYGEVILKDHTIVDIYLKGAVFLGR